MVASFASHSGSVLIKKGRYLLGLPRNVGIVALCKTAKTILSILYSVSYYTLPKKLYQNSCTLKRANFDSYPNIKKVGTPK